MDHPHTDEIEMDDGAVQVEIGDITQTESEYDICELDDAKSIIVEPPSRIHSPSPTSFTFLSFDEISNLGGEEHVDLEQQDFVYDAFLERRIPGVPDVPTLETKLLSLVHPQSEQVELSTLSTLPTVEASRGMEL